VSFKVDGASASAVERESGVREQTETCRDITELIVSKRKADKLSRSDSPSAPDIRRPTPSNPFDHGPRPSAPREK
jgi:hypothetical protein